MAGTRRRLIAGNWKMNGTPEALHTFLVSLTDLLSQELAKSIDIVFCPPATLIADAARATLGGPISVGAQDCHAAAKGAHTGDLAAEMIAAAGGHFVIVGHSERRADHGESDMMVRAKAEAAHRAGLVAIICVGETEAERDAGQTLQVVRNQIELSLPATCSASDTVIAYEPVWAIGTGRTPTGADVEEVHRTIRVCLTGQSRDGDGVRILYGGSVKPDNASELLAIDDVDGALVGGASLDANDFFAIIDSCR